MKPAKHLTKEIKRVTEAIEAPQLKLQSDRTGVADLAVSKGLSDVVASVKEEVSSMKVPVRCVDVCGVL